ncbi:cytochrome P450 [Kibdelosporangium persicum]|uniref:Pentalenolactone synthase n=1 Tax=Kibdelosporangium persicum TaxID=2698649 RepID=A0ABX2F4Z0_9PSEU|nr:cytochrome P450 [Kibdelosporangium persicum]NRN66396.1 Pentalenolactone synthase [Kibdelosporangium persicum]
MDTQSFTLPFDRRSPFEPPAAYADLRKVSPVVRTVTGAGTYAWVVLGAKEAQRVLSDKRFAITREGDEVDTESLLCDGEHHARLRRVISRGFSPRTLGDLRPVVDRMASDFVTDMRAAGSPADLVAKLSRPLTLAVITEMLGVPVDDRERFYKWAETVSAVIADDMQGWAGAWGELVEFLGTLIEAKRATPGPDLLSAMIAVRDSDDGRLNDRELMLAAASLLSGGQLTTVNSLTIGVIKMLEFGGGLGVLHDDRSIEIAVEEMLRHQAGISGEAFPRWAREDVELGGHAIAAGDMVIVRLEAANRDPAVFTDPDRFDPRRTPNQHVKFGYGPHRCIGAAVARMELVAAVRALADQLPGLKLATPLDRIRWTDHPLDSGPAEVIVTW